MNTHVPFAVVGSTDFIRIGNKMMRSRQYPWGTVQGKIVNFPFVISC
jgi:septin 6/8/11